jgi:hypothetical protein
VVMGLLPEGVRVEHGQRTDSVLVQSVTVRPWCPLPLDFGSSNGPMGVIAPQKCATVYGRAHKGVLLDYHPFHMSQPT